MVPVPVDTDASDRDRTSGEHSVRAVQSDNVQSEEASDVKTRQQQLCQHFLKDQDASLPGIQKDSLLQLLLANHHAFALAENEGERGETNLQMDVDTGMP